MSSEYNYDTDAQFFPFFILTVTTLITLPLTYSLLRAPSGSVQASKAQPITSDFRPPHADIIDAQRAKQKRKELRRKRIFAVAAGWAIIAYMVYLMMVTARLTPKVWDPYEILDVSLSASEKDINRRYRKLSVTMHPDKRQPKEALNETIDTINTDWVEIVKAYKALTDEEIRNNFIQYGNPDGRQSTSFGIALPKLLVAEGSGKYVLLFYGALLGIGLPWFVGTWWYGMQKITKEKIQVTTAGNLFREVKERMDGGDVVAAVSSATELRDILHGHKADSGLGKVEKEVHTKKDEAGVSAKDLTKLGSLDDAGRRKALALLWAYLGRVDLKDSTLEAEKYEMAPTALQISKAYVPILLAFGSTPSVIANYELQQGLVQAIAPGENRSPLLQLPHFTSGVVRQIEEKVSTPSGMSVQSFMALPANERQSLATGAGLSKQQLSVAEGVAKKLPYLQIEKAFFKVQGEKYIIPGSLVQFVIKARFIPPGTTNIPKISEKDLQDIDPAEGDLAAQKAEPEQHAVPLAHSPYLPMDKQPQWYVMLTDKRQSRVAVPPFTFTTFDKQPFDERGEPTFNVVTLKMQFQAPPQKGEYKFVMHLVSDSYLGFDHKRDVRMTLEDASKVLEVESDDDISEPEEDTIAGQMAKARGTGTSSDSAAKPKTAKPSKKKADEESDYESGTDEDEDEDSETDTDTDTDTSDDEDGDEAEDGDEEGKGGKA